jgi:hypothetical protein
LLEIVASAWRDAGFDVDECFRRAVSVTNEWKYTSGNGAPVAERIAPKWISERAIPHKLRSLEESLNPQPLAASVIHTLLDWIDRVDFASQRGLASPPFQTEDGEEIFPDEPWWLTDVQRKEEPEGDKQPAKGDEDGPASSEEDAADLEEAPADDALEEDEDPLSDAEDTAGAIDSQQPRNDMERDPNLGWRKSAGSEQQQPTRESSHVTPVLPLLKKRRREPQEAGGAVSGERGLLSSSPIEHSAFMRACSNNPDDSLPQEDQ